MNRVDAPDETRPDAVLDWPCEKDLTGACDRARAAVRARLTELAVEGRVRWDGERAE
jgi:hypothetical protein